MDEFDSLIEDDELPLHLRIAQKYGKSKSGSGGASARDNFYVDSEDEQERQTSSGINQRKGVNIDSSPRACLTPPPPFDPSYLPSQSYERPYEPSVLDSIDNLLDPGQKSVKIQNKATENKTRKETVVEKPPKKKPTSNTGAAKLSKEYKEAEKLHKKQTDKSEVNKYIQVCIDPEVVSSPPGAEILNLLTNPTSNKEEEIFSYTVENQKVPSSLTWRRKVMTLLNSDGQPVLNEYWIEEQRTLIFASAQDIAVKIEQGTFSPWAQSITSIYEVKGRPIHHVTLVVYGYNAYLKLDRNAAERAKKAAVRGETVARGANSRATSHVSEYQFQEALLTLSIEGTMDYLTFDKATDKGWKECAGLVFHHTRAIAEAPDKLKKNISSSAGFDFYAKADVKDSISPKNLVEYWKQVLMQVTTMSLEKANAISQRYSSPTQLIQAYRNCYSEREAELLLANIEIRRVDTIVGGTRRLGDEISKKIYYALTSEDPVSLLTKS
eukprot:TRINITY_DN10349_c0_g1_i4.p1 TRINITY_DN10349_c0_g1~~TRINITY_DN10349_c0_g1_i4.p1  ORF type:complete len:495 (-),score=84.80 TRINITY_DN10349_c0_g1_i4:248-1732(-)